MRTLPVEVQGRRLVQGHPSFRPILLTDWFGLWEGTLCPVMQPYRVRVRYVRYDPLSRGVLDHSHVEVFVLDPAIGPDPRGTGEPTPHVYRYGYSPDRPALCLFDPARGEWSPADLIADTIIPWTIEWLLWFELWVWDGTWRGGGRHPGEPVLIQGQAPGRRLAESPDADGFDVGSSRRRGGRMSDVTSGLAFASWVGETATLLPWRLRPRSRMRVVRDRTAPLRRTVAERNLLALWAAE